MEEEGMEQAVETNQKHLIKKILARYPNQWTFFRELVQNADDACAKNVLIQFETEKETKIVKRTIVSNDGNPFSNDDWKRLTSIASGNPDPNKVGFFGVGFYSVFALSDAPTVESSGKKLDFFWKGNALYTRQTTLQSADNWTRFILPVLESINDSSPPPTYDEIGGFLAELLCFSRHLETVKVTCDGHLVVTANRKDEFELPLTFPTTQSTNQVVPELFNRVLSKQAGVKFTPSKNDASISKTKLTLINHQQPGSTPDTFVLIRAKSTFETQLSDHNARLYLDMTQKRHPSRVQLSILMTLERTLNKDALQSSLLRKRISPAGVKGRVFIGFVTSQSTGLSCHVAGPFIPTVERENLDFATDMSKAWNINLFNAVGALCRVAHEHISSNPQTYISQTNDLPIVKPPEEKKDEPGSFFANALKKATSMFTAFATDNSIFALDEEKVDDDSLFSSLDEKAGGGIVVSSMAIFSPVFTECRPFTGAAAEIWKGFLSSDFPDGPLIWTSLNKAMSSDKSRVYPSPEADVPQLSFIESFPVIPTQITRERPSGQRNTGALAGRFVEQLKESKLLCEFDLGDILTELQKRPLRGTHETLAFVEWYFAQTPLQLISVRCGNCGAISKIKPTITEFNCATCRYRLTYQPVVQTTTSFFGFPAQQVRTNILTAARCILEDENEYQIRKWKYKLDPNLEPNLDLIKLTLAEVFEEICPLSISSKAKTNLNLTEFDLKVWIQKFFSSNVASNKDFDLVYKLLFIIWKSGWSKEDITKFATSVACIPTTKGLLQYPKLVYTTEIEESKDIFILSPIPPTLASTNGFIKFLVSDLGVRESVSPAIILGSFLKGNLSREQLWHFLHDRIVVNKETIEPEVINLLAKTKCLGILQEDGKSSKESFQVNTLFTPASELIELHQLPIAFVPEPSLIPFLETKLGLMKQPTEKMLLAIAGNSGLDRETRIKALTLLAKLYEQFNFVGLKANIVPCKNGVWSSPVDCFIEVPSFLSHPICDLKEEPQNNNFLLKKLQIKALPPPEYTIEYLSRGIKDKDGKSVWEILDFLATRQFVEMSEAECQLLSHLPVIPVNSDCLLHKSTPFVQPRVCYFESEDETVGGNELDLKSLVCFIPKDQWKKSHRHKGFYQSLGVRDAPTLSELSTQLCTNPQATLQKLGNETFLNLLRLIASDFSRIKVDAKKRMKSTKCVLGKILEKDNVEIWNMYLPSDVIVEDDSRYRRLFPEVPSCPCEPSLEQMYLELGSSAISKVVTDTSIIQPELAEYTTETSVLDRRLCERLPVLIQKVPSTEFTPNMKIWMDRAAKRRKQGDFLNAKDALVMQIPKIRCEMTLKGITKTISTTACVYQDRLFVTKQLDFFHVASALAGQFLSNRSTHRSLLWATLLQSTGQSLEEMGFVLPKDTVLPTKRLLKEEEEQEVISKKPPPSSSQETKEVISPPTIPPPSEGPNHTNREPSLKQNQQAPPSQENVPVPPKIPPSMVSPPSSMLPNMLPSSPPPVRQENKTNSTNPFNIKKLMPPPELFNPVLRPPKSSLTNTTSSTTSEPGGSSGFHGDANKNNNNAIQNALSKCRPNESRDGRIFSPASQIPLSNSLMDCTQPHDLQQDEGIGSIECFTQKGCQTPHPFRTHMDKGREFSNLLVQMAMEIFQLDASVVHLYFDERNTTRAFNRGGSLFFNLYTFVLDDDTIKSRNTWTRWFGTFCHELAHNNWAAHDAQFANFLELFCVSFSENLLNSLKVRGLASS